MEQHPIPQNISSYQFRLVGDMTLKQFFELAGGILVGLIFYSSPLLPIIRWPFVIFSVILGVALAFLPFEERPLEKWIFSFFRAIYSPTLYYWKKSTASQKFFQDEGSSQATMPAVEENVEKYLGGSKIIPSPLSKLEDAEKGFLSGLSSIFSSLIQPPAPIPVTQVSQPALGAAGQVPFQVPLSQPTRIAQETRPKAVIEEVGSKIQTSQVQPIIMGDEIVSTRKAIFSIDAAPPNPPTAPNIVVGQAVDADRKIIEGAIMEIKDSSGRPIRALKSNKLGHFTIVTPLDNGRYDIVTEKDGFEFSPVSFEATGELIPPILVQGRRLYDQNPIPVSS